MFERFKGGSSAAGDMPEGEEGGEPSRDLPEITSDGSGEPGRLPTGDLLGALDEEAEADTPPPETEDPDPESLAAGSDERRQGRTRAEAWARRAAEVAGLVRKPRGRDTPERRLVLDDRLAAKARQLVVRVVLPGEWYLVRWGGTRKGSGSFYTRPGLAVPTVQRTLRPLAFDPPAGADGTPDRDAPPARWTPKRPEEILALTVCDPACGSGTFPLAALRFLTDALYASLQHHGRIEPDGERSIVRLLGLRGGGGDDDGAGEADPAQQEDEALGAVPSPRLGDELIPCPPDDERFEPRLKAVLRRHVVERCIYAVDLDPLAVELCRLSLWIETMDRTLPFGFLDHKVKCGNALVGAWFDQFRHYPVMAWKNREGGDKNHANGVHFEKGVRTAAIKAFVKDRLTPDLKLFLQGRDLFQEDLLEESLTVHDDALAVLGEMHSLPVQDAAERARIYRERLLGSPAWRSLKRGMDLWCACWFWPGNEIDCAPLPSTFTDPPDETRAVADRIAAEMRFFHWEHEFPDVYREAGSGFDAILGNPPWENLQANPEEFFANADPLFRTYGRLAKNKWRQDVFAVNAAYEDHWLSYTASFKYLSNWIKNRVDPFGNPHSPHSDTFALGRGGKELHERWRTARSRGPYYADTDHPFRYQMGRIFTYQLFLEQSIALLRTGGRCGLIIPSGIYSDSWSRPLRGLLLEHCRWEWLFGIENREGIFPIHRSYKFNPVIVEKGQTTEAIRTAFMCRRLEDWERAEELATSYTMAQIERFSPRSQAILEIQSERDLEIIEKIYRNGVLLGDDSHRGWGIKYKIEFMMNSDAHLFPPRPQWEEKGYRPDEYSRWLLGDWRPIEELWDTLGVDSTRPELAEIELEDWMFNFTADPEIREVEARLVYGHLLRPGDVARTDWCLRCAQPPYDRMPIPRANIPPGVILARDGNAFILEENIEDIGLPFYEGRMIGQFDISQKGWVSGKGRSAIWREIPWESKQIEPQFLMGIASYNGTVDSPTRPKLSHMRVASSTNTRTATGVLTWGMPAGDTAATFSSSSVQATLVLTTVMNSLVFDFVTRRRLIGLHLDYHVLEQNVLPFVFLPPAFHNIVEIGSRLNFFTQWFAPQQLRLFDLRESVLALKSVLCLCRTERTRQLAVLNSLVAEAYGLDFQDILRIVGASDLPCESLRMLESKMLDPKGFWRVDKDLLPELRYTVLTLVAFHDLESKIRAAGGDRVKGIEAFLAQNDGVGWMLPETLRLADYGLGHDERARHPQPVASRLGPRFYDWQLVQSADESWRECHLHARNLLGAHEYALLLVELIERRAAAGGDYLDLLTDAFTRELLGDDGYATVLTEIRSRGVVDADDFWPIVADLRRNGHLDEDAYGQLLDKLHARGLLDDLGYRRRRGRTPPAPTGERFLRVAEEPAEYRADHRTQDGQPDLFE